MNEIDKKIYYGSMRTCAQKMTKKEIDYISRLESKKIDPKKISALRAISLKGKTWPQNMTLKVAFIEKPPANLQRSPSTKIVDKNGNETKYDPLQKELESSPDLIAAIKRIIMERIQPMVNLKFEFIDNFREAEIRIGFDPSQGAWSYVGTDNYDIPTNERTLNLGWFDVGTVIHEVCHAVGLCHEHQSPYGNLIDWNYDSLYSWAETTQGWDKQQVYEQIIKRYSTSEVNGTDYDPSSVMLYFFDKRLTNNNEGTSYNPRLSITDIKYIMSLYPGAKETAEQFYNRIYKENINSIGVTTLAPNLPVTTFPIYTSTLPPITLPIDTSTLPPITLPIETLPPITFPPITLPIETLPPATLHPITFPPITLPIETSTPDSGTEATFVTQKVKTGTVTSGSQLSTVTILSGINLGLMIFLIIFLIWILWK